MMSETQLIEATFVYQGLGGKGLYIAEKPITAEAVEKGTSRSFFS
jgi:hypothetical protein